MQTKRLENFYEQVHNKKVPFPFDVQIELTYRCNLNCVHCYGQGLENNASELKTSEIKRILDELHQAGCIWVTLTGGEPLIRNDFLELYAYAKRKGFIISILTNGQLFNQKIIAELVKSPPYSLEITMNGITQDTYEKITQSDASLKRVIKNIKLLVNNKFPLVIKTNLLKQNKLEIARIKKWAEKTLGKPAHSHYFKYDPMVYPRINGDRTPCDYRLSYKEMLEILKQDKEMQKQHQEELQRDFPHSQRHGRYLYHCNTWMSQSFINPYGRLKFCLFSEKFSVNLRKVSFKDGFNKVFPKILELEFKTDSFCRNCRLRAICVWCPVKAKLETGQEEKPVEYYCQWAKALAE